MADSASANDSIVNGSFSANGGGWTNARYTGAGNDACSGGQPNIGTWDGNGLTFSYIPWTVNQSVIINQPSTVTFSVNARNRADNSGASASITVGGSSSGTFVAPIDGTTVSVSTTTTTPFQEIQILISGSDNRGWAGCYGTKITNGVFSVVPLQPQEPSPSPSPQPVESTPPSEPIQNDSSTAVTPSPSPSPTSSPEPSPSPTPTPEPIPSLSPSPESSPQPSPSETPTSIITPTPSPSPSNVVNGSVNENGLLELFAPIGKIFDTVLFASYGTPNDYTIGACHATSTLQKVSEAFLGKRISSILASNGVFGDPCGGTYKRLQIILGYSEEVPQVSPQPSPTSEPTSNATEPVPSSPAPSPTSVPTVINSPAPQPEPIQTAQPQPSQQPAPSTPEPTPLPSPSPPIETTQTEETPNLNPEPQPEPSPSPEELPSPDPEPSQSTQPDEQPQTQPSETQEESDPSNQIDEEQPSEASQFLDDILQDGDVSAKEVDALVENVLADGVMTEAEKEIVVDAVVAQFEDAPAVPLSALADAGIFLEDLPPATPVETRQDENGNAVIIVAEVAVALQLLESPAEMISAIFESPAQLIFALGNLGADMSPQEREEATKTIVAATIVGNIATTASMTASMGAVGYRRQ